MDHAGEVKFVRAWLDQRVEDPEVFTRSIDNFGCLGLRALAIALNARFRGAPYSDARLGCSHRARHRLQLTKDISMTFLLFLKLVKLGFGNPQDCQRMA